MVLALALSFVVENAATQRDQEVIQAYIQRDTRHWPDGPKIVLMTTPAGEIPRVCTDALERHLAKYPALANGFVSGLQARSQTKADYSGLKWAKWIHLTREDREALSMDDRFKRKLPFEREYRAELPAYSPDGKMAVLITWQGPNDIHHVRMISLLKRNAKGWTVSWSLPGYYP